MPPTMMADCPTDDEFLSGINRFFKDSVEAEQRIVYFTGHGKVSNGEYGLLFGKEFLAFNTITSLLKAKGPAKTLFILDACHSGAADFGGVKIDEIIPLSAGASGILASSRDIEFSHEDEELGSLFTHYLCECITTGNGGKPTTGGLITVPDAAEYIRVQIERSGKATQNPRYTIKNAEGPLWLAINISGGAKAGAGAGPGPESRLDKPCTGASMDDLDQDLLLTYARDNLSSAMNDIDTIVRELDLSHASHQGVPTETAILCFGRKPSRFFPDAASMFSAGDRTGSQIFRSQVDGPLLRQLQELVQLVGRQLQTHSSFSDSVVRADETEIPISVLREAIANALAHRNFSQDGRVHVHIDAEHVEISNPGVEPAGHSWEEMLDRPPGLSLTPNRRLANLLQAVGGYDGIGRGFSVLNRYRKDVGEDAVSIVQKGGTVVCRLKRPPSNVLTVTETAVDNQRIQSIVASRTTALAASRDVFRQTAGESFVEPTLISDTGGFASVASVLEIVKRPGSFVTLVGSPGAGKTHLLKHLAIRLAGDDSLIPIFASLRNAHSDLPLEVVIAGSLGVDLSLMQQIFLRRHAVLLLDGLDECVPSARAAIVSAIAALRETYPNASIMVSSRSAEASLLRPMGDENFTLGALSLASVRELITRESSERKARQLWTIAQTSDPGLFTNPLLLKLLMSAFEQFAEIPSDPTILMSQVVDLLWQQHDSAKDGFHRSRRTSLPLDEIRRLLEGVAFVMLLRGQSSVAAPEMFNTIGQVMEFDRLQTRGSNFAIPEQVVDDLLEAGLLTRDGPQIVFAHRSFQEHLAARGARRFAMSGDRFAAFMLRLLDSGLSVMTVTGMARDWDYLASQHEALTEALHAAATESSSDRRADLGRIIDEIEDSVRRREGAQAGLFDL